jgi:hypothetical protein
VRATLALIAVLLVAAAVLAGCGGSSDQTLSAGEQTITVPGDVHGFYGELEAILDQFPYQRWYTKCVVARVKKSIPPAEAEAVAKLSESQSEEKATQAIAAAGPACEESTGRAAVDPNASSEEIAVLRADYLPSLVSLGETNKLSSAQIECVEQTFENLPDKQIVAMSNGSHNVREGILLSVFEPCAKAK